MSGRLLTFDVYRYTTALCYQHDQVSEILLISKRTIPGASQLCWSLRFDSPQCKHESISFYWVCGPNSLWEPGFLAYHSCVFWPCPSSRAQLLLAMWGQGWRCLYRGKAGTVLFAEGVTDAAAYSLSLSSPLRLLPPSAARNTPETPITYTGWEWCQSGCWLRAAGVCFSVAFHTLCTTLLNPGGLVPLWAPLYHPSKSPLHETKSQLAKESWRLGSTKTFVHSSAEALSF